MRKSSIRISIMAVTALMIELILIPVTDVPFYSHNVYMFITCAVFAFGLVCVFHTVLHPLVKLFQVEQDQH